jgi:hypothetical protein
LIYNCLILKWIFSVISLALPFLPIELQIILTPFIWLGNLIILTLNFTIMEDVFECEIGQMKEQQTKSLGEMERR